MWRERQISLLRKDIAKLLEPLANNRGFLETVNSSLTQGLRHPVLELLPVMVCESVCGDSMRAIPASSAIVLIRSAGDVFDDVEDDDNPGSVSAKYGRAVATNAATALIFIAESALVRLKTGGISESDFVDITQQFNHYHLIACSGQHLDICFTGKIGKTENELLRVIEAKTASQLECSCYIGALLGKANKELTEVFCEFGKNLGMAAQIANDIKGIVEGNDIAKRKITLAVVYAFATAGIGYQKELMSFFTGETNTATGEIRDILFKTGAVQYAVIKMETYRQEARESLAKAKVMGASTRRLQMLLARI